MAKVRVQVDEIAANGDIIEVQEKIGYKVSPILGSMDGKELVCVDNLSGILGNAGSDKFYSSTTPLPIIMINGVDFFTTALRPIVNSTISKNATTDTNNGSNPTLIDYNFTDASKTILLSITLLIPDSGSGLLDVDMWVRVV